MRFVNTKSKTKKTVNNISKKVYNHNTTLTGTDYLGGFQYKKEPNQAVQLQFFPTAEGYVNNTVVSGINQYSYVYNYTDHLGNIRLSYKKNGTTLQILEENNYYPFGLKHTYYNTTNAQPNYKYKYNGKEYQDELGLNFYDYGARNYDTSIGRWMNVDPKAAKFPHESPYIYCSNNPIRFIDPDGRMAVDIMPPSNHLDENGKVVAVFNDGDNGVYQHGKNADGGSVTEYQLSRRAETQGTSSGGTKVGETAHWDEFVSPEIGKAMTNTTVQVGKSFDPVIAEMHGKAKGMDLMEIASASAGGGIFDIKVPYANVGGLLNGKYATSRSAGNFLAGYNAESGTYLGVGISFTTFQKLAGALHIEESHGKRLSFWQKVDIVILGTYISSDKSKFVAPMWGEVNYQYRMSKAGWNFGQKK